MIETNRNGTALIVMVVLLAIITIITAAYARQMFGSCALLRGLSDEAVARENAATGLEHAKAAVCSARDGGAAIPEEGLTLPGEGWSASVRPGGRSGACEIVSTGRAGRKTSQRRLIMDVSGGHRPRDSFE